MLHHATTRHDKDLTKPYKLFAISGSAFAASLAGFLAGRLVVLLDLRHRVRAEVQEANVLSFLKQVILGAEAAPAKGPRDLPSIAVTVCPALRPSKAEVTDCVAKP